MPLTPDNKYALDLTGLRLIDLGGDVSANRLAWVEALEDGRFPQHHTVLRCEFGFCAMGVAYAITPEIRGYIDYGEANREIMNPWRYSTPGWDTGPVSRIVLLPCLQVSLGVEYADPDVDDGYTVSDLNDAQRLPFREIAGRLRKSFSI